MKINNFTHKPTITTRGLDPAIKAFIKAEKAYQEALSWRNQLLLAAFPSGNLVAWKRKDKVLRGKVLMHSEDASRLKVRNLETGKYSWINLSDLHFE